MQNMSRNKWIRKLHACSQSKTLSSRSWFSGSLIMNLNSSFHSGLRLLCFTEVFFEGSLSSDSLSLTYGSDLPIKSFFLRLYALRTFTWRIPTGFLKALQYKLNNYFIRETYVLFFISLKLALLKGYTFVLNYFVISRTGTSSVRGHKYISATCFLMVSCSY